MKAIFRYLLLALFFYALSSNAQNNYTGKSIRFINVSDSVAFLADFATFTNRYGTNIGALVYYEQSNKFRVYANGVWSDLGGGGGGGITAYNGLGQLSPTDVFLGGPLTQDTEIGGGGAYLPTLQFYPGANNMSIGINGSGLDYATLAISGTSASTLSTSIGVSNGAGGLALLSQSVTSGNVFSGKTFFNPTATLSGLNIGSFAGNPSSLINGDKWYNSTLNQFRVRKNGITYDEVTALNGVSNTQIPQFDGNSNLSATNLVVPSLGSMTLGVPSQAGTNREIRVDGSGANIGLFFVTKGSGLFAVAHDVGGALAVGTNATDGIIRQANGGAGSLIIRAQTESEGNGGVAHLNLRGGDMTTTRGTNVIIRPGTGTSNGYIILQNIPTSSAGLPSGAIWSNAGVLTIVP